jgi:glycosyltransferase involved in cell wall biosynthesis
VNIIPHGIDTELFAPRDQHFSRDLLGIPHDVRVVLCCTDDAQYRRKGFTFLQDALAACDKDVEKLLCVSFGPRLSDGELAEPSLHLGLINDERMLSFIYSAADLFVVSSVQETFNHRVLQAMACGTPVVAFNVGGMMDQVRDGQTGALVPVRDSAALRHVITRLLGEPKTCRHMSAESRRIVIDEYAHDLMVKRYAVLYESITRQNALSRGQA